jgi:predicted ester cyclase
MNPALASLHPAAYAPYRDPRDYILSWTDEIWVRQTPGLIRDHYGTEVKVHTAYAETYDLELVIQNSLQKMAAFPNGGGGVGEDVIWEPRGSNGFISSHRVLKCGTHLGPWNYGPPTGRDYISRTVAHCLVKDGLIVEEWLARDEYAVLTCLGIDPWKVAGELAQRSPVTGTAIAADADKTEAFGGRIADPARLGVSGVRPDTHHEDCALVTGFFDEVWNKRLFHRSSAYISERSVLHSVRMKRTQGRQNYESELIDLLARFPDCTLEIRDIAICDGDELGRRIAVIWLLRGTYCGVPFYGPVNNAPVTILGASHFEIQSGKLLREWRVFDEIAVMAQILSHGGRNGAAAA